MGQIAPTLGLARKTSAEAKNGSEWRIATGDGFFSGEHRSRTDEKFFSALNNRTPHLALNNAALKSCVINQLAKASGMTPFLISLSAREGE
jgi:hypothetical protein